MTRSVRISGHFGELLQGRLGPQGPVALITLPCPVLACTASQGAGPLHLRSKGEAVMRPADLRQLLTALGLPRRGRFQLTTEMPVGAGLGASTAARVALARAAGVDDPQRIAMACLAVEGGDRADAGGQGDEGEQSKAGEPFATALNDVERQGGGNRAHGGSVQ